MTVLPVADDEVCVSCYNPVVVSCYNQHFPGVNHRTYIQTQIRTLLLSDVIVNRAQADVKLGYLGRST